MTAVAEGAKARAGCRSRPLVAALRYAIGVVLLAVGFRTWLVLGWIEPVYVAGSSMAPAYRPAHRLASCSHCLGVVRLAAEPRDEGPTVVCPWCTHGELTVGAAELRGDRLWIDRTAYLHGGPRRWEVAAVVCPDTGRLCIKRVRGLPG